MSVDELTGALDRLVRHVGHWQADRWAAPVAEPAGGRRGDVLHELIQRIADLAADREPQPRRSVPRLDTDLALPDQLRVVIADLLATAPPPDVLGTVTAQIRAVHHGL